MQKKLPQRTQGTQRETKPKIIAWLTSHILRDGLQSIPRTTAWHGPAHHSLCDLTFHMQPFGGMTGIFFRRCQDFSVYSVFSVAAFLHFCVFARDCFLRTQHGPGQPLDSFPVSPPPCSQICLVHTSSRLFAGISLSAESCRPWVIASASRSWKLRMPLFGSRSFSHASKLSLLGLV